MKSRIDEIKEQIKSAEKKVKQLRADAASAEMEQRPGLEVQAGEWQGVVDVLKQTLETAEYQPPEVPSADKIAGILQPYITDHGQKVQAVRDQMEECRGQIEGLQDQIAEAVREMDTERATEYSRQQSERKRKLEYMEPVLQAAEAAPVFPSGSVVEAWEKVCSDYSEIYRALLENTRDAAEGYRKAAGAFLALHATLFGAREKMQRMAADNGSTEQITRERILTAGLRPEDYTVLTNEDRYCITQRLIAEARPL